MNKYTPEQLNRLNLEAAKIFDIPSHSHGNRGREGRLDIVIWNPTDKNSAQAQNILIPRLIEMDENITIDISYEHGWCVTITDGFETLSDMVIENPDDINACITECCVEAMKKLKEIE